MDKFISISIYIIYLIIASVSIVIASDISIVICLIVIALEYIRVIAIYKKVYSVMVLVFLLNLCLISYTSYKDSLLKQHKNQEITTNNQLITNYLSTNRLRANTFQTILKQKTELTQVSLDYQMIIGVYLILELSLLMLIIGLEKQNKAVNIPKKPNKIKKKPTKQEHTKYEPEKIEDLEYIGSYQEYSQNKKITRDTAKRLFDGWKSQKRITRINGKNYLRGEANA